MRTRNGRPGLSPAIVGHLTAPRVPRPGGLMPFTLKLLLLTIIGQQHRALTLEFALMRAERDFTCPQQPG